MACKMCVERGKNWVGDDPKCAFDEDGAFSGDNWNCATMNKLRHLAEDVGLHHREDMGAGSFGAVYYQGGYIILTWYKNRGRTSNAMIIWEEDRWALTEQEALKAIREREVGF
jgi:hypothetical protein